MNLICMYVCCYNNLVSCDTEKKGMSECSKIKGKIKQKKYGNM